MTLISKAERDYLSNSLGVRSDGYDRIMRSRLHKKMQLFVNQELPLLIEKGYTTEFRNSSVSDFSNCRENTENDIDRVGGDSGAIKFLKETWRKFKDKSPDQIVDILFLAIRTQGLPLIHLIIDMYRQSALG